MIVIIVFVRAFRYTYTTLRARSTGLGRVSLQYTNILSYDTAIRIMNHRNRMKKRNRFGRRGLSIIYIYIYCNRPLTLLLRFSNRAEIQVTREALNQARRSRLNNIIHTRVTFTVGLVNVVVLSLASRKTFTARIVTVAAAAVGVHRTVSAQGGKRFVYRSCYRSCFATRGTSDGGEIARELFERTSDGYEG
jgi:hypothetical protein